MRGYARVARSRPLTPKSPSASSTTTSSAPVPRKQPAPQGVKTPSNTRLPADFKLAKIQATPDYDPNMVIFLDKHGNVSMIPHDDRVTGQTREEFDAALTQETEVPGDDTQHQRGSKEAEYGRKRIGQVQLPLDIQDSIRAVLDEHDKSLIRTDALRLYGSLRSTGSIEEDEFMELPTKRMKSGSGDMTPKGDQPVPAHILEYGHRESTAYLAAIAPTTYSAIRNVLEEVDRRVPNLNPKSFLDFGTGPGTAIWAASDVWETPLKFTGVDTSMAMLETAEEILDIKSSKGTPIQNVTFKPFMSHGAQAAKYDIVMSAFTLSELTTPALRKSTLEHLWNLTNDMLILIDRGTPSGFKMLAEAREQILGLDDDRIVVKPKYDAYGVQLPEEAPPKREPAHVLAPCPHDKVCPMYATLARDSQWCHFSQKVQRPDFLRKTKHSKENFEDAKYTYVILRKGARPVFTPPALVDAIEPTQQPIEANTSTPTVPPLKKDGHVVIDTCGTNGFLERIIIPKSQGKIPYRDARKAMWGDLFPHLPKNKAVRKETVKNMFDDQDQAEGDDTGVAKVQKRRPLGISTEMLLKRAKQKEKKQSRQKISVEQELDGTAKNRRNKRRDGDDIVLDF
ncbi:37S ribosomal protein S22 [Mortierella alpina]|nr:37S ribosomal protein S22 [Mortierella alpina]